MLQNNTNVCVPYASQKEIEAARHTLLTQLSRAFQLPSPSSLHAIPIVSCLDTNPIERAKTLRQLRHDNIDYLMQQIDCQESCYLIDGDLIYLAQPTADHLAEELAHAFRQHVSQAPAPAGAVDTFYDRVLNEAIGFMGAQLCDARRSPVGSNELEHIAANPLETEHIRAIASLSSQHKRLFDRSGGSSLQQLYTAPPFVQDGVAHCIGYQLGDAVYHAYQSNKLAREDIHELLQCDWSGPGDALATYLYIHLSTSARAA